MTRREGSAFAGLRVVFFKELADLLSGSRMRFLEALVVLTALGTVYAAVQTIKNAVGEDPFLFLRLFTTAKDPLPSFVAFLGFLVPLLAIALGFDAVNGEFQRRTLGRVLSQPIYRDALLFGKFLAGLTTLAVVLTATWLLVTGLGILLTGLAPSGEEVARGLLYLLAALAYGAVWLALALLFSTLFKNPATSALATIAVWLFFTAFWGMIAGVLAPALSPVRYGFPEEVLRQAQTELALARISPGTLYAEATLALLRPEVRALGPVLPLQLQGMVLGTPLPLSQSLLLVWPQFSGLVAASVILFVLAYVFFQRQEIRA
jgi:ABC-type transport system involved in multi-copper enzyme maturation, permease component